MAVAGFALLIRLHRREGFVIGRGIVLHRNEGRHATHRKSAALMAGLNEQFGIAFQEMHAHRNLRAVRHHKFGPRMEFFNHRENIIPAPTIQAHRVILERVQNLVHLKRRGHHLDQHRRFNTAMGDA